VGLFLLKMAAKGKYTKERVDKIAELIRGGNFASVAYGAVGLSHQTYHRWLKEKCEFNELIKRAKAERISSLISAIKQDGSWQSKAWMLERLNREKYHLLTASEKEMSERLDKIEERLAENKTP
jgi:hypothetical protein